MAARHPQTALLLSAVVAVTLLGGCAFTREEWQFHRDLLEADRMADEGLYAAAEEAYMELAWESHRDDLLRYIRYRVALMQEKQGEYEQALASYAQIYSNPYSLYDETAGEALLATARIVGEHYDDQTEQLRLLAAVITAFPNTVAADDALFALVDYWEARESLSAVVHFANEVYPALMDTEIADNLLYRAARIADEAYDDCSAALPLYATIIEQHHRSGFVDDAIWYTAGCYRRGGDIDAEYGILTDFVQGRELSFVMADYDSEYYGDAYWRLAEIHEERQQWREAIRIWKRWQRKFPLSLKVDDVQFHVIELYGYLDDTEGMRRELQWLRQEYPHSRYIAPAEELIASMEANR